MSSVAAPVGIQARAWFQAAAVFEAEYGRKCPLLSIAQWAGTASLEIIFSQV